MRNAPYYGEAPEALKPGVGALFVDLDETLFRGTVTAMSDGALAEAEMNPVVAAKIREAQALGIPVVMCTRNDDRLIERFFQAHPEARALFTDTLPCPTGLKSDRIKQWLREHGLTEEQAAFLDDNAGERRDVEQNVEGSQTADPAETHRVNLRKTRGQVVSLFRRRHPSVMETDQVALAA